MDKKEAERGMWWNDFLQARMKAIQAQLLLGSSKEQIVELLNLGDVQASLLIDEAKTRNSK